MNKIDLEDNWSQENHLLEISDLRSLSHCSLEFSRLDNLPVYPTEDIVIKDLTREVDALYQSVSEGNLPEDVQKFLLEQLEIIRRAIRNYRFRGVSSLQEALERNVGASILNSSRLEEVDQEEDVKKFKDVIGRLYSIVSKSSKLVSVGEQVVKYLPYITGS